MKPGMVLIEDINRLPAIACGWLDEPQPILEDLIKPAGIIQMGLKLDHGRKSGYNIHIKN